MRGFERKREFALREYGFRISVCEECGTSITVPEGIPAYSKDRRWWQCKECAKMTEFSIRKLPSRGQNVSCTRLGGCDNRRFEMVAITSPSGHNRIVICGTHAEFLRDNLETALKALDC